MRSYEMSVAVHDEVEPPRITTRAAAWPDLHQIVILIAAMETARGLLGAALVAAGYPLYPIYPMAVARYCDR